MDIVEIAEEFTDLWQELSIEDINAMLGKNVNPGLLEFFLENAHRFIGGEVALDEKTQKQLANPMLAGYIIRILEERIK